MMDFKKVVTNRGYYAILLQCKLGLRRHHPFESHSNLGGYEHYGFEFLDGTVFLLLLAMENPWWLSVDHRHDGLTDPYPSNRN